MSENKPQEIARFFEQGKMYLLSKQPYKSMNKFAKILQISKAQQDIELTLSLIAALPNRSQVLGYEWARRLLLIGLATKFPLTNAGKVALDQIGKATSACAVRQTLKAPIIIVTGGSGSRFETQMQDP